MSRMTEDEYRDYYSSINQDKLEEAYTLQVDQDSLVILPPNFWDAVNAYFDILRKESAAVKDRTEMLYLERQVENDKMNAKGIMYRRISRLIEMAAISADGTDIDLKGMTKEEKEMFERLKAALKIYVDRVNTVVEV